MKKKVLGGLVQYGAAVLAVVLTVLYIVVYNKGIMPFSEDETVVRPNTDVSVEVPQPKPEISEEEHIITATEFLASLPMASTENVINSAVYDGSQIFVRRSISPMGDLGGARLSVTMGYLYKRAEDGTVSVFDSQMRDVTSVLDGLENTFCRDAEGRVLFYGNNKYSYLQNGVLTDAVYDPMNFDKGVEGYKYPAYLSGGNSEYTVFGSAAGYGLRRNADGETVIEPKYADVYAPSEGYSIAVTNDGSMHVYTTDGKIVSDGYRVPVGNGNMIGYFFVDNGLFRACTADGREVLVNTSGAEVSIPSDYGIVSYSDGVLLVKGADGNFGYFTSGGKWLGAPYYENAKPFYEGLAVVCRDGLYGMINTDGDLVIPCVFDSLSDCQDGVIVGFTQKNGYCVLNKING